MVKVGATLTNGDILVNKITPVLPPNFKNDLLLIKDVKEWRNEPTCYKKKGHNTVRVDRVMASKNEEGNTVIKTMLRECRRPEYGDKFSSRHG